MNYLPLGYAFRQKFKQFSIYLVFGVYRHGRHRRCGSGGGGCGRHREDTSGGFPHLIHKTSLSTKPGGSQADQDLVVIIIIIIIIILIIVIIIIISLRNPCVQSWQPHDRSPATGNDRASWGAIPRFLESATSYQPHDRSPATGNDRAS
jgi:hypothetical protein